MTPKDTWLQDDDFQEQDLCYIKNLSAISAYTRIDIQM